MLSTEPACTGDARGTGQGGVQGGRLQSGLQGRPCSLPILARPPAPMARVSSASSPFLKLRVLCMGLVWRGNRSLPHDSFIEM